MFIIGGGGLGGLLGLGWVGASKPQNPPAPYKRSLVTIPSGYLVGGWVGLRVGGWVSQNSGRASLIPPPPCPPSITKQWPASSAAVLLRVRVPATQSSSSTLYRFFGPLALSPLLDCCRYCVSTNAPPPPLLSRVMVQFGECDDGHGQWTLWFLHRHGDVYLWRKGWQTARVCGFVCHRLGCPEAHMASPKDFWRSAIRRAIPRILHTPELALSVWR